MHLDVIRVLPSQERATAAQRRTEQRRERQARMGEQRRETLLAAAMELLDQRGLEGFNMREMAARAGYSAGALYAYFDSKDAILAELRRRSWQQVAARVAQARPSRGRAPKGDAVAAGGEQAMYLVQMQAWWGYLARDANVCGLLCYPWAQGREAREAAGDGGGVLRGLWEATAPALALLSARDSGTEAAQAFHGHWLTVGLGYLMGVSPGSAEASVRDVEQRYLGMLQPALAEWFSPGDAPSGTAQAQPDLFGQ